QREIEPAIPFVRVFPSDYLPTVLRQNLPIHPNRTIGENGRTVAPNHVALLPVHAHTPNAPGMRFMSARIVFSFLLRALCDRSSFAARMRPLSRCPSQYRQKSETLR